MKNSSPTPEQEHAYLQYNGYSSLAIAFLLFMMTYHEIFRSTQTESQTFSPVFIVLGLISLLTSAYWLLKGNKFNNMLRFKSVWLAYYNDEFLNQVNLSAYKSAFFSIFLMCGAGYLGLFSSLAFEVKDYCSLALGVMLAIYGTTITLRLREDNE